MRKLWGGAFSEQSDELVDRFGQSIDSDFEFWAEDVIGSIAHAKMLGRQGIISAEDCDAIVGGLKKILQEGCDQLPDDVEDIHTAVETRLHELIGEPALRLHTGRSRNDQVATDSRLYLRRRTTELMTQLRGLQQVLLATAEKHLETVIPGVTHQQHGQPITLAFHLMAHFWMHQRHQQRLDNLLAMTNWSPLGAAALAGTPFPIDRQMTSDELGFEQPIPNALDATSDRTYILDAHHVCASIMIDLSRLSQELVLWSTPEFGFIQLSDRVTTGSSIMPQKRNPDMAELVRGKTGKVVGNWTALAVTMKGLVLGYNRDTQEDKPPLFESLDTVGDSIDICRLMIVTAVFRSERMLEAVRGDFSTATDLADALAKRGMPFREAHEASGKAVRFCQAREIGLEDLTPSLLEEVLPGTDPAILPELLPAASVARRTSFGGTAPSAVASQIESAKKLLSQSGNA